MEGWGGDLMGKWPWRTSEFLEGGIPTAYGDSVVSEAFMQFDEVQAEPDKNRL